MYRSFMKLAGIAGLMLSFAACAQKPVQQDLSAWREESPRSILALLPVNQSPDVKASNSVLSVLTRPLAEAGFYVIPVGPMQETFQQNGLSVAGDIVQVPYGKLHQIFGADAALYTNVRQYGASYSVINSRSAVTLEARLVSLRSGRTLWQGRALVQRNSSDNSNGIVGMLLSAAITQLAANAGDVSHVLADEAAWTLLQTNTTNGILPGPRAVDYGKSQVKK